MTIIIFGWQHTIKELCEAEQRLVLQKNRLLSSGRSKCEKQQTVLCSLKDEKGNLWFGNLDGSLTCYYKKERSFKILRLITEMVTLTNHQFGPYSLIAKVILDWYT